MSSFPGAYISGLPSSAPGSASPEILSAFAAARSAQAQQRATQPAADTATSSASPRLTLRERLDKVFGRIQCQSCTAPCKALLRRKWWHALTAFFAFVLLFGSQIQHLWVTPKADVAFDVLYLITFVFFVVGIFVRTQGEDNYFLFQLPGSDSVEPGGNCFTVGSFMFYCDVVSTATLLYNISFINKGRYESPTIDIDLDSTGIPISGFDDFNRLRPVELEINLLVTIARTSRVARFVRSRTVINLSSKINWYWFFHNFYRFNPLWYWKQYQQRNRPKSNNELDAGDTGALTPEKRSVDEEKRNSWFNLHHGVLATVKAQADSEDREAKQVKKSADSFRMAEAGRRFLRKIGIRGNERVEIRRQIAASKIQRAWRAHMKFDMMASHDGSQLGDLDGDIAWSGRGIGQSERVLQKRSFMVQRSDRPTGREKKSGKSESRFQSRAGMGRDSQVGSDMRELTGERVALGVVLVLIFTVIFTYTEVDTTRPTTMIVLHSQTSNESIFRMEAISAARNTSTPDLLRYTFDDLNEIEFEPQQSWEKLRDREILIITVKDYLEQQTVGLFSFRTERIQGAWVEFVATMFILIVWFFGVTAFTGPVMSLVVIPIERMVRLLGMLMLDPLGYQSTARFKKFLVEEDTLIKNTRWTKEVLKGMETSFLMSTILRIGSLMKVGFGSAGVEIIRNNLQRGHGKNMLILNSQGSTVACIFLFCDIRQFTDATECLQEEVFVFTNRIAAVVHSICHSYGGAANKNVGDAFLLSWLLDDDKSQGSNALQAKNNQADKALLSVIKICIALHYDAYYIETMSEAAKTRLQNKLKKRHGPIVQMGFGLHAGKAVQGAIGSQRKIDATYVSEAVERAEFLESSTKQYGLKMLMSSSFHRLLHQNTRRRCRKVDQILLMDKEDDDEDEDTDGLSGETMELFTFDMDIDAIHRSPMNFRKGIDNSDAMSDTESTTGRKMGAISRRRDGSSRQVRRRRSAVSLRNYPGGGGGVSEEMKPSGSMLSLSDAAGLGSPSVGPGSVSSIPSDGKGDESNHNFQGPHDLVLPTGPALYSHNVWQTADMKRIRDRYVQGLFFQKFNAGLQSFYKKDWNTAKQCFQTILDNFEDGPSLYFMKQIKKHDGVPPKDFMGYGIA